MDPILKVIQYLFDQNNVEINIKVDTVKSFFEDGILFPKFVSLAFNIDEISNIHPNPSNECEKEENNELTLQFLTYNFSPISNTKQSFHTELDQINFLKLILTKQCFPFDEQDILHKCNIIVDHLDLHFTNMNALISWENLLLILKVLSNEEFQEKELESNELYNYVIKFFKQCKIPLVIDEKSLEEENRYLFLIQLQILIDFYLEKNPQITKKLIGQISIESESSSISDDMNDTDTDTDTDTYFGHDNSTEEEGKKNLFPKNYNETESNPTENDEKQEETKSSIVNEMLSKIEIDEIEINDYDLAESSDNSSDCNNNDSNRKETTFSKDLKCPKFVIILILIMKLFFNFIFGIFKLVKSIFIKKKKANDFIVFKEMEKNIFLKTVNAIASNMKMNKHFNNIHDTIKNDWIPKFVMHFLQVDSINDVHLNDTESYHDLNELSDIELRNIASIIEYLKEKEPKFDVLSFNFKNYYLSNSSAVLFYTTFLNFFFLKKSRKKLFDRCVTILFPANKEGKNEIVILTNWSTYIELTYFVVYGKKMKKNTSINERELFTNNGIPQIINKNYLTLANKYKEIPDAIYYQLQFIFDALDNKFVKSRVIEYFLIAISKLVEMRFQRIDFIVSSIRAKNISLILQIRRHKEFELKKQKIENNENKNENKNENMKEDEGNNGIEIPLKYIDRSSSYSGEKQNQNKKYQAKHFNTNNFYEYWNPPNSNYIFKDGILINKSLNEKENELTDVFNDEIAKIFQLYEKDEVSKDRVINSSNQQLFDDPSLHNETRNELYKIFAYDEQSKKWLPNIANLNKLSQLFQPNSNSIKTPLILFMDSSEQELIELNSNLIFGSYPSLEENKDNNIFIYVLCDRLLSHLNYKIDTKNENKSKVKPIFFLLHVPKNKETLPNIQSIVTSIYSFLSNICDIKVVLLDKQNYKSQLEMVEMMNKINDSYGIKIIKEKVKPITKNKSHQTNNPYEKGTGEYFIDEIIDLDEDNIGSFDSSSSESDYDEYENDDRLIITQQSKKKQTIILLINEKSREFNSNIDEYLNQSDFFKSIKDDEIKMIHFINTAKTSTYKSYLDKLNEFLEDCQTLFEEIKEKIEINEIINLCTSYISTKTKENWKEELEDIINKRFFIINDEIDQNSNCMTVLLQLRKEISSISLPFDSEFQDECKSIISKINNKMNQKNREILKSELETSSNLKINNLNKYEDYEFKSIEKVEDIKKEHINFIKEEFNDIIKVLIGTKKLNIFYEENIDILNKQIENDMAEINQIVHKKELECNQRYVENEEQIDIGSNIIIREVENVREIKVQIEVGEDLKDQIEQDF